MILRESSANHPTKRISCKIKGTKSGGADIHVEGYGQSSFLPGFEAPLYVELYQGKLMLYVWADINNEEPTHVIDLEGARESKRK